MQQNKDSHGKNSQEFFFLYLIFEELLCYCTGGPLILHAYLLTTIRYRYCRYKDSYYNTKFNKTNKG